MTTIYRFDSGCRFGIWCKKPVLFTDIFSSIQSCFHYLCSLSVIKPHLPSLRLSSYLVSSTLLWTVSSLFSYPGLPRPVPSFAPPSLGLHLMDSKECTLRPLYSCDGRRTDPTRPLHPCDSFKRSV